MKKICVMFLVLIFGCFFMVTFTSCSNKKDITIEFVDDYVFTVPSDFAYPGETCCLSFYHYGKLSKSCESRAYSCARLNLFFNITPENYKASDVYQIKSIILNDRECFVKSRQGEEDKIIEIIIPLKYITNQNTNAITQITYTEFDNLTGGRKECVYATDYIFQTRTIPNYVSFNKSEYMNITYTTNDEGTDYEYQVDTNINYDKIIYNIDTYNWFTADRQVKSSENLWNKGDLLSFKIQKNSSSMWYGIITFVGFQKDGINYYFNQKAFSGICW